MLDNVLDSEGKKLTEPQVFVFSDHAVSTQTCQHNHMIKNPVKCLESQVPGVVEVCKVGTSFRGIRKATL